MSKSTSYSVDDDFKKQIEHYAKTKGFANGSAFSKYAVVSHMRRHPLKKSELLKEDD